MSWKETRRGYRLSVMGLTMEDSMNDEGDAGELTGADPHPRSQHRTPCEIAQDEAAAIRSKANHALLLAHHSIDHLE
jgi:hypothetical protein